LPAPPLPFKRAAVSLLIVLVQISPSALLRDASQAADTAFHRVLL
jgi:hypothetical protein